MAKKKKRISQTDIMKYEIAKELGLSDKVDSSGWAELTAAETGRIGGIISGRKRKQKTYLEKKH